MGLKAQVGRAGNRLLKRYGYRVVSEDRLYDWQKEKGVYFHTFRDADLPADANQYLVPSNPRLADLRSLYAAFARTVTEPLVWTPGFVRSEDLKYFRGDNGYVWQLRGRNMNPLGYALTAYYVRSVDKLGLLDRLSEDDAFGLFTFLIDGKSMSRDLLDSVNEINFLERELNLSSQAFNILDIGAGYGRLAHRMTSAFPRQNPFYFCTDAVPESTFLCEFYLGFRGVNSQARVVPLYEIDSVFEKTQIDLAINVHSFSECQASAIEWWITRLAQREIRYLLVVPNAAEDGGRALINHAGVDFGAIIERHGYRLLKMTPKYGDPLVQEFGIASTYYHLFERR